MSFPRSSLSASTLVAQTVMVEPSCSYAISSIPEMLLVILMADSMHQLILLSW